jgi:hypothetical protein
LVLIGETSPVDCDAATAEPTGTDGYSGSVWGGASMARHQWTLIVAIMADLFGTHHLERWPPVCRVEPESTTVENVPAAKLAQDR